MNEHKSNILSEWIDELSNIIKNEDLLYIAIVDANHKIEFCNELMAGLLGQQGVESFINPKFETLTKLQSKSSLIFKGHITFGDMLSVNTSLFAHVYKKNNKLLIIGGSKIPELLHQNTQMAELNREVNNLQRELIIKNQALEQTLLDLNKTNAKLESLNKDKDLFISILAHDLKSPFNSLLGFSSLLADEIDNLDTKTIKRYSNIINEISTQSYYLLDDVLNWYKSQSGNMPYEPVDFHISELLDPIHQQYQNKAVEKNIKLDFTNIQYTTISADFNMLSAILRNFISNAIKFTPKDGIVELSCNVVHNTLEIKISDTGVGISDEDIQVMLNSSQIKSKSGTKNEKGTGLGLFMCKEFIRKHNGILKISSEIGKGSVFTTIIPQS